MVFVGGVYGIGKTTCLAEAIKPYGIDPINTGNICDAIYSPRKGELDWYKMGDRIIIERQVLQRLLTFLGSQGNIVVDTHYAVYGVNGTEFSPSYHPESLSELLVPERPTIHLVRLKSTAEEISSRRHIRNEAGGQFRVTELDSIQREIDAEIRAIASFVGFFQQNGIRHDVAEVTNRDFDETVRELSVLLGKYIQKSPKIKS